MFAKTLVVDPLKRLWMDPLRQSVTTFFLVGVSCVCFFLALGISKVNAGWVNGYFRSDGTYVMGHYRTEPNYYKWDNYSWNGDWSDSINDKSWYRDYGYDPEPWDDEYPSYYNYNFGWDDYGWSDWDW